MSKIVVHTGGIIDSVSITYKVENTPTPLTVQHGGPGGVEVLSFDIGADEKLVAVYGTRLVSPSPWKERHISQLSFIVVKSTGDALRLKFIRLRGTTLPLRRGLNCPFLSRQPLHIPSNRRAYQSAIWKA